jgi:hypothetical protein
MTPAEAVAFMKAHKILKYRCGDLEIELAPEALDPEMTAAPEADKGPDMDERSPRMGLTRQEQIDLFGQTFEDDYKRRPGAQ